MKWKVTKLLGGYSYLHEVSFLKLFRIKVLFHYNLLSPPQNFSEAALVFHTRDSHQPQHKADFCITGCNRWELDVSQHSSFDSFLEKINSKHKQQYRKTEKIFNESGATISRIEEDWSKYADTVYQLYENVALKRGTAMYDRSFFHAISKEPSYKLLCAWLHGQMIGVCVLVEEFPILHSMCAGIDYEYSKKIYAYSKLHYEFIRWVIESKKFTVAEIGITADTAKSSLGFKPIPSCIDISSPSRVVRPFLRFFSKFVTATITSESKMKLGLKFFKKNKINHS